MKKITVIIQGREVEAHLLNPDVVKRYEDGFDSCIGKIKNASNCDVGSEGMRKQCQAVIDYVTDIFGEEGAGKIFGLQTDLLTCMDVLEELQELYPKQINPIIKAKTESLVRKFKTKKDDA